MFQVRARQEFLAQIVAVEAPRETHTLQPVFSDSWKMLCEYLGSYLGILNEEFMLLEDYLAGHLLNSTVFGTHGMKCEINKVGELLDQDRFLLLESQAQNSDPQLRGQLCKIEWFLKRDIQVASACISLRVQKGGGVRRMRHTVRSLLYHAG